LVTATTRPALIASMIEAAVRSRASTMVRDVPSCDPP